MMQVVVEIPTFTREAERIFSDEELHALIDHLATDPQAGVRIPGTGGVRKLRFAGSGKGKRGGVRVIYFYGGMEIPVYALMVIRKSVQEDMSPTELKIVKNLVMAIKNSLKERR